MSDTRTEFIAALQAADPERFAAFVQKRGAASREQLNDDELLEARNHIVVENREKLYNAQLAADGHTTVNPDLLAKALQRSGYLKRHPVPIDQAAARQFARESDPGTHEDA